jgi:flavorubredoxin
MAAAQSLDLAEVLRLCEASLSSHESDGYLMAKVVAVPGKQKCGIYQITHPITFPLPDGGHFDFSYNSFLLIGSEDGTESLLWETGFRGMFAQTVSAIEEVMDVSKLKYISFSHHESDEDGAANEFLNAAPNSIILTSKTNAMINSDQYIRTVHPLSDNEKIQLGHFELQLLETPHFPHGWEACLLFETNTRTLLASDLLVQVGRNNPILRTAASLSSLGCVFFDDPTAWAWTHKHMGIFQRLAALSLQYICAMHGSSFVGPACSEMLLEYAERLKAVYSA